MEASHPVISLLAFVDSDIDETLVDALREATAAIAAERDDWVLGPPELVDESDAGSGIRTVGATLALYAAFDGGGELLDEAIDRRQLEDVRALVAAIEPVSARHGADIGFELDGESVGWLESGAMTDGLRVGLLDSRAARFA
jgi:hypothetical protein